MTVNTSGPDALEEDGADEPEFVEVPVPMLIASPTPEVFAEIVKQIPPGYALVPAGYELRAAPPLRARPSAPAAPAAPTGPGRPGQARQGAPATARTGRPAVSRPAAARTGTTKPAPPNLWELPPGSRLWSSGLTVFGVLLLVFAINLLAVGQVRHMRDQRTAMDQLRIDLANGTAPVDKTTEDGKLLPLGTSLGYLEIPQLGVKEVYFEGTTSGVMQSGPGHRRDTVMPGQFGTSVIMGRATAYGAPFAGIADLPLGSEIKVTNGLGKQLPFTVTSVRRGGDPLPAAPASGSRITLVSALGAPYSPEASVRVDADLQAGVAQPGGGVVAATVQQQTRPGVSTAFLPKSEKPMAGERSAWLPLTLGLALMLPLVAAASFLRLRWGRLQTWLAMMPPLLAASVFVSDCVVRLLPNLT